VKFDIPVDARAHSYWENSEFPDAQSAVLWYTETPNARTNGFDTRHYISVTAPSAPRFRTFETKAAISRVMARWSNDVLLVEAEVFARPNTCKRDYAAEGDHGISPALFNTATGELSFIAGPFFPEGCAEGAESVVLLARGDFWTVNTPGDCLFLRQNPAPDAAVITCIVHGATVNAASGNVTETGGIRWRRIHTISLQDGWVAEEFLRR
jgi:hypothetical protein